MGGSPVEETQIENTPEQEDIRPYPEILRDKIVKAHHLSIDESQELTKFLELLWAANFPEVKRIAANHPDPIVKAAIQQYQHDFETWACSLFSS